MSIIIHTFPKGPLGENTYLIKDEASAECAVIDPGYIGDDITGLIEKPEALKYIIITHAHFDHFFSAQKYVDSYPSSSFVGPEKDIFLMNKDMKKDYLSIGWGAAPCPKADILVNEDSHLELGGHDISFIETPGHTEGSMCILCDGNLFSGDTLFKLSVGNTSFETGSWEALENSIRNKLFKLDDDIKVLPGHGSETTIGYERRSNPFV